MPPPNYVLLDHLLKKRGGLRKVVLGLRKLGYSWRKVAEAVVDLTGQPVSWETLRTWFSEENGGEAA